jgi:hypothetical protein
MTKEIDESILDDSKIIKYIEYTINGHTGTIYDIARILHYLYKEEYICGKIKSKVWYHFKENKWTDIETGPYCELSTNMVKLFFFYQQKLLLDYTKIEKEDKKEEKEALVILNEKIENIIFKLKTVSFKESVCRESLYLFHQPDFIMSLDRKEHLVCFNNGIWDTITRTFRTGERDDMISLSIGINLDHKSIKDDDLCNIIENFKTYRRKILNKRSPKNVFQVS